MSIVFCVLCVLAFMCLSVLTVVFVWCVCCVVLVITVVCLQCVVVFVKNMELDINNHTHHSTICIFKNYIKNVHMDTHKYHYMFDKYMRISLRVRGGLLLSRDRFFWSS